ncbi:transglycosylase family protein [Streptomyces sp. ISL-96]|uniref:transglycosylase family protein n=1 Tax=Streptomyces sp. ISL-96 TaxID=2819191 RepID=UPI001BEB5902|nr:transglycosylase family protein [Streptomyces sp. ISL-96]MBT2493728.1 transglycosylase family protein [Streptomyces sp. ISL-96]
MAASGRHRRYQPSRINRASLTVTAGGAGIALPLVASGSADAASVDVWEKVAACESTNDWKINTGNGYYGGLQFKQSTWQAYGGTAYARRADLATKDQQIAVAEKVLNGQGPTAWPLCSVRAGLTRGGDAPGASTEAKAAPKTATQSKKASAGTARPGTKDPGPETYTVASGDTLSAIADAEDVRGGWRSLYTANRDVVGSDPDIILPGQRLSLDGDAKRPEPGTKEKEKAKAGTGKKAGADRASVTKPAKKETRAPALSAPVETGPSTPYRAAGSSWAKGYHTGVDFPVPTGTAVKSVAPGRVVSAGWGGAYGYQVVVQHVDGKYSQYAHLSALTVREGQKVGVGQRIGRSGSTGNSTGPHLHFEVRTGPGYGSDVDPLAYLRAGGVTI